MKRFKLRYGNIRLEERFDLKETIMGIGVNFQTYEELKALVLKDINNGKKGMILAVNPEKIMQSKKNPEVKQILQESAYTIPDGIGVILASKIQKGKIKKRITGVDMMEHLISLAAENGKKVGFYGGKPGIARDAAENLKEKYPSLEVSVVIDGYETDQEKIRDEIRQATPDIVFVALGSPKQEKWIREHLHILPVSIYQGVGGSFDIYSGNVKRAPEFWQKYGLEWFYRLMKQPSRIKRQLNLLWFLLQMISKGK